MRRCADGGDAGIRVSSDGWLALRPERMRGVRELAEEPGHHEDHLLADVDGVVADALQRAGNQNHVHRPLARIDVIPDLQARRKISRFSRLISRSCRTRSSAPSSLLPKFAV